MLRDSESPSEPQANRPARALGRGLEDISHLFLSSAGETSAGPRAEDPVAEQSAGGPVPRARVAVLRPGTGLTKDQLTATILECRDALEEGMRALDAAVPCGPHDEIDLLALDRFNRLTVVEVDTILGDSLLLRGISHVDWVTRNLASLRRTYRTSSIDASRPPRLVLVAPRFTPILTSALRQLTGPMVVCFRYHTVASFGGGILIERLSDDD